MKRNYILWAIICLGTAIVTFLALTIEKFMHWTRVISPYRCMLVILLYMQYLSFFHLHMQQKDKEEKR